MERPEHLTIDCSTREESRRPLTASEQVDRDAAAAQADAERADAAPIEQAVSTREARAEAVVEPTANLLDAITGRLADLRGGGEPSTEDMVLLLEAVRQLGLKGVADEAAQGRASYARVYNDRVPPVS